MAVPAGPVWADSSFLSQPGGGAKGCKWMLQRFRQYLASKHGPEAVETLFSDMDNIFIRSLQSVQKVIISDKHCFELYGYDILIDQDLKP